MARKIEETEVRVEGLPDARITTQALPIEEAEDHLPDVLELVSIAGTQVLGLFASGRATGLDDVVKLLPAIPALTSKLNGGRLSALHRKLCRHTTVVLADESGEKTKYDLASDKERAACLEERPDLYLRLLLLAVKVTYQRFFPGLARLGQGKKTATPSA